MSHGQPTTILVGCVASGEEAASTLLLPPSGLNARLAARRRSGHCSVCFSIELRIVGSLQNWHLEMTSIQTPVLLDIVTTLVLQTNNLSNASFCFCLYSRFPTGSCQGLELFFWSLCLPLACLWGEGPLHTHSCLSTRQLLMALTWALLSPGLT